MWRRLIIVITKEYDECEEEEEEEEEEEMDSIEEGELDDEILEIQMEKEDKDQDIETK